MYTESLEMMFKENGIVVPLAVQSIRKLLKIQDDNNIILSDIEYEHRSHHFTRKKHLTSALRPHSSDVQRGVNKILDCSMTHMHYINSLLL